MTNSKAPKSPPPTPPHLHDLSAVLATARNILAEGAINRHAPAHTPTFATISLEGRPRLRTIVLRGFEESSMQLWFHTDRRSRKIDELLKNPSAALHVYDRDQKVQLQISGLTTLHLDDDVTEAAWAKSRPMSRMCYQITQAPGSVIKDPHHAVQEPSRNAGGSDNFMVAALRIEALEWLFLDARGHRRARFSRNEGAWSGTWLVP